MQTIVDFLGVETFRVTEVETPWVGVVTLETGVLTTDGKGVGASGTIAGALASCFNFNLITGDEKWNPAAETRKVSPTTLEDVVTTSEIPSSG